MTGAGNEGTLLALPDFTDVPDLLSAQPLAPPVVSAIESWSRTHPADTRGSLARKRLGGVVASAAWAGVQLWALGVRGDFARLPASYLALTLFAPAALGVAALIVALSPGELGLGARRGLMALLAIAGPVTVIAAVLGLPAPYPDGAAGDTRSIFFCGNIALAWAALPLACAALTLRRSFVSGVAWRSALVGAACGLGAAAAAQLRCSLSGDAHVVFAHVGAAVIATVAGALLLPRATRI